LSITENLREHLDKHNTRNHAQQILCDFCGYNKKQSHQKEKCPAKGKACKICSRKGHFAHAKVCPGKVRQVGESRNAGDESSTDEGETTDSDVAGRVVQVNKVTNQRKDDEVINIAINGIDVKVRVDSGCRKVLLPEKVFRKIQRRSVLKKTKV